MSIFSGLQSGVDVGSNAVDPLGDFPEICCGRRTQTVRKVAIAHESGGLSSRMLT